MATIDGIDGGIFVCDHLSDVEATPTNIPKDTVKDVALCPTGCPLPVVTYTTLHPVPEPGNATTGVVVQSGGAVVGVMASDLIKTIKGGCPMMVIILLLELHSNLLTGPLRKLCHVLPSHSVMRCH